MTDDIVPVHVVDDIDTVSDHLMGETFHQTGGVVPVYVADIKHDDQDDILFLVSEILDSDVLAAYSVFFILGDVCGNVF